MNPMLIVAIPLVVVIVGMVLNSIGLSFDQPPSSAEQDPAKRAATEAETFRRFFDTQRRGAIQRQKRIGQYCWLLLATIIGSFIWLYNYTVTKTIATTQTAVVQTMAIEDGKDMALMITLKDGSTAKYRIQSPTAEALAAATKDGMSRQKLSSYDMDQAGTILNMGENPLPLGIALKVSVYPTIKRD
jgi:hypothetical protein